MNFKEFMSVQQESPVKKWHATKDQILDYWKNLRSDSPIIMNPISYDHKGSTYGEDNLRITGSPQFIGSVLSKLKGILSYETPSSKLALTYRQTDSLNKSNMSQNKISYAFYVAARQRGIRDKKSSI